MKHVGLTSWIIGFLAWLVLAVFLVVNHNNINKFNSRLVGKTPEGFHRSDMRDWCLEFQKLNPGITCPDPYSTPAFRAKWNLPQ